MLGHNNVYFDHIGLVARWKPVHLGHSRVLKAICHQGREIKIGIGSTNRYNLRNPFTLEETEDMIRLVLKNQTNYVIIPIEDLDDGPKWRDMVKNLMGTLDIFVTDNPYVANLMQGVYSIAHPSKFILPDEFIQIDGTMVRKAMAQGSEWQKMVPPEVEKYISTRHLDIRFRKEFGLQTLSAEINKQEIPEEDDHVFLE